jgi:ABC-2 type transport system permease protein
MNNVLAVARREFAAFFSTPIGFVVLATFALITGLTFTGSFLWYGLMTENPGNYGYAAVPDFEEEFFSPYMVTAATILMFIGPLITMRLLAEEHNAGTSELLFTHPLSDRDIVFGKYAAALGMLAAMVALLIVHVLIMYFFIAVEPAVLVFGLVAVFLMGAAFMALGLFVSALCRNQITAATLTFGVFFFLWIMGFFAQELPETSPVPADWPEQARAAAEQGYAFVRAFAQELPIDAHAKEMAKGIFQPRDVMYYLLVCAFFLFLTFRALERRHWKGGA